MSQWVCVIDLGSTDIKAAVVDREGSIVASSTRPAPALDARDGSFDPGAYASEALGAVSDLVAGKRETAGRVEGISLSSQRSTTVFADESKGARPTAISWQGSACAEAADRFYTDFGPERFHRLTGLTPSYIYTVAKLAHRREMEGEAWSRGTRIDTLHGYVIESLGGDGTLIDHSIASASGLYDVINGRWSNEILDHLGLNETSIGTLVPAGSSAGELSSEAAGATGLLAHTPIFVGGGD